MGPVVRTPDGDRVERRWEGKTVVCLGSGPSVTKEQVEATRGQIVVAVNDNYLIAPWAEVCYFADHKWWVWHSEGIEKIWPWVQFSKEEVKQSFASFAGQKVTIKHAPMAEGPDIYSLRNDGPDGLCEKPDGIRTGMNSGYQAVNLTVLAGAKRILLLGYDFVFTGGRSHSHNGHPQKMGAAAYTSYAQKFGTMGRHLKRLGVVVVNCSTMSALKEFPFGTLEKELNK